MELAVGDVFEGKVTGMTAFGAFVQLPVGRTGMVHISEVADTFVDDIKNYLTVGQQVKVKVIGIDASNRVNLSIKKASAPPPPPPMQRAAPEPVAVPVGAAQSTLDSSGDDVFEAKLKSFMQNSKSRMSDIKAQSDKKSGRKRK